MRSGRRWWLMGGLLALAACAALVPKLEPPTLQVVAVQFEGGNSQQQNLRLTLHVKNPNDRAISVRGIECNLDVSGNPFAEGKTEAAFSVPALGETDFPLDVVADVNGMMAAAIGMLSHRTVDYRVYGRLHLQGLLPAIPFDTSGRVRL